MSTRVLIKTTDRVQVLDLAWSQLCELLAELSRSDFKVFLAGEKVLLPDGTTVKEIKP